MFRLPILYYKTIIDCLLCYSILRTINEELEKITAQGRWMLGIYKDVNSKAVDGCLDSLSTALEKFKVGPTSGVHCLGG